MVRSLTMEETAPEVTGEKYFSARVRAFGALVVCARFSDGKDVAKIKRKDKQELSSFPASDIPASHSYQVSIKVKGVRRKCFHMCK